MMKVRQIVFSFLVLLTMAFACCGRPAEKESIDSAVAKLMEQYPKATLWDVYKSFYQDRFGPGHLLSDMAAAMRYLESELQAVTHNGSPLYEPTGWKHQFYRVSIDVVRLGLVSKEDYFSAFYRSAQQVSAFTEEEWRAEWQQIVGAVSNLPTPPDGFQADSLRIDSMMRAKPQAVHHSTQYNKTYAPHYRIIAKEIFKAELLPLIEEKD